ncbi:MULTISPECIES: chemotaxis protein CheW [Metabacillus]|jgi:purine-binding chemotaxis protein CheW|uniref:Chemotaxis protein CheW n=1 Tax=Metabacillus rhizolycopersici TaxID=2875709 RepID=A0ABS7UQ71_9BACI|nr:MULTISPECIES: chemotaxis protein CheW [Metabacillus]MBZ5750448.1 chemotaxis protein CheW [Metabacillus rhizolycopersici]MCM3650293.1 chemotaxis protein CheW [Metabacillus litoralis]
MNITKVVVFRAGNEEYGLPIEHVISIEKLENIKSLPNMPSYMKGVVKVRGELIPVLDTNHIFYQEDTSVDENVKLIVVQSEELTSALIVKEAKEILDIQESQLKSIPIGAFQATKYFMAVASVNERLITIIQPNLFVSSLEGIALVKEEIISYQ